MIVRFLDAAARDTNQPIDAWSKIYVLNRFYFDVPDSETASKVKYFGGWGIPPQGKELVNILWPLAVNASGKIYLKGAFGGYTGDSYDALGEFDYFLSGYGL